ncbi:aspartyl protease family protein At5g10770-like isoform X2 [Phragmites australis]|uniref:aspartyl protease family protein At5g10770-like isoform X2 n=1 Tax=Phragmites australis TaxID=29695 RepID=UPI002D7771DC|nr:aspartyl protease family protein At5g10770-like isoform X2 [Phragmites australis]
MAAASSPAHLLCVLLLLVVGALVDGSGGQHGKSAVLSLRELEEWGAARRTRSSRDADAKRAETLGEHKKAGAPRTAATVLELKHHSVMANPDDPTARDRYLSRLLAADEARASSLQLRNRAAASTQSSSGQAVAAQVPLTSGIRFQTLNYVTTISLGGSSGAASNLTVIVDTGSDLTWVQCKPCSACYAQRDPLFDPAGSATYAAVPCNASACAASLKAATGTPGSCASSGGNSEKCYYALAYGDGSFSRGVLATDTIGLGGASLHGFVFGCGLSNRGLFGGTAGLMGLGRTELSLVSQTASRYGGVFSYCLPATTSGNASGSLSLGGDTTSYRNTTSVAYTRMIADPAQPPFYFLNVTGAAVGGTPVAAQGLGASNVLIDSGTVITRLAPSVYRAVRAEFTRQFGAAGYPAAPGFSILDTCYDLTGHDEVKVPLLTLRLEGGADVTVDAAGMLFVVRKDGSQVCLAMASLSYEDQTPIIGNYQQKNKRVVYDTAGSRLGFADEDCSYV